MQELRKIPSSSIFSVDIETVRITESFHDLSEEFQDAWSYKNKQNGEIPTLEELAELWVKTASLYAEFAKICAVSIAWADEDHNLHVREMAGEDELEILEAVHKSLTKIREGSSNSLLVGHAAHYFDYPFICKRLIINGMDLPLILDNVMKKPWDNKNLCTNDIWKMGGTGAGSSLQALCTALNIPISKVDLVGDEVGRAYYQGQFEKIGRYCSYDAIATLNVVRKLKGEDIFEFDQANYLGQIKKVPVLVRIYNASEISDEDRKELLEILGKKKLTKKGKGILVDMLHQLSINSKMVESDKPE
ncbi:MAG: hypothetical protein KDH96_06930, partial [Candidatus Riesia sp.]|nr:hypothetical protein [Candidatus Riesia sp.]